MTTPQPAPVRVPCSTPDRCDYLYDDSTLAGAIHLEMYGDYLQCDHPAVWEGILPPDPDQPDGEPMAVALCTNHAGEAEAADGLTEIKEIVK